MIGLALRNILRNRRRTAITLFLIISGTFLISALKFIVYGFQEDMISRILRIDSGLIEVAAYGWSEKPTLSRALESKPGFLQTLQQEGVEEVSPRIRGGALLTAGDSSRFISVLAANPEKEKQITTIHNLVKKGKLPFDGKYRGAMIGNRLARSLALDIGSRFYLVTSQIDGSVGALELQLTGIYEAKDSRLDSSRVMITLEAGRELFGTRFQDTDYYTSIALGIRDNLTAARVKNRLQQLYPPPQTEMAAEKSEVYLPVILDWKGLNPGMVEMMRIATMKMDIFLVFFVVSIAFGVLNTVQMSIQERLREFGILIAIGTKRAELMKLMSWEILLLIVPGVATGVLFAVAFGIYFYENPIQLSGALAEIYEGMGFIPRYRPIVDMRELWFTFFSLVVPSFLLGLLAARRITKLDPVKVIGVL